MKIFQTLLLCTALSLVAGSLSGCSADEAIKAGTDCDQSCPLGAEMLFAKEASGSCGADGSYKELGEVSVSGNCQGTGECQVVCKYPKCGETQTLRITADEYVCEASKDKCVDVDCDGHGQCRIVDDSAVCQCDDGYVASGIHCDPVPVPVVTVITPTTAKVGVAASFTIVGQNLPDTLTASVENCAGLSFTLRTETTQVFSCTPSVKSVAKRTVNLADGSALYEDEVTFVLECDHCEIAGQCFGRLDPNPDDICLQCDPDVNKKDWTFAEGKSCDDGIFCNGPGVCLEAQGGCIQQGMPCADNGVFCDGSELDGCNETKKMCESPGNPCQSDQYCSEVDAECLDEVVVNVAVSNKQFSPRVASWEDGSFVVLWQSYSSAGYALVARKYISWGEPAGQDIALLTQPVEDISGADIIARGDGSFVVAWGEESSQGAWSTKVRLYDGEGVPKSEATTFSQPGYGRPVMAGYPGALGFVVTQAMKDNGASGSEAHWIWAQEFNQYGVSAGNAVKVNDQVQPWDISTFIVGLADVAVNSKENKAFVWFGYDSKASEDKQACIRVATWAQTGLPSNPFYNPCLGTVGDFPNGVAVAANKDFDLFVLWSAEHDDQEADVFVAWLEEGSADDVAPVILNEYLPSEHGAPAVASGGSGAFGVWSSFKQDGDLRGVYGRRIDETGQPHLEEMQLNVKTNGNQKDPSVCALGDSSFVVVWEGDAGLDSDIFMRKVDW